ncbi:alpha/beta fold hydrolase [Periweissella ghanensis]|uniref:Aminoacrylate hydrolase RutD n=1 Tax=Periweissella ghanensis TaxID=467997 RepID=A0ABN8BRZ1_9LACO|nr:alpha/beta hydrolase [Periweissella ghanensis]MCM0600080.1 alpha/beta fold hydrolase [Periweissella ghanensis]CAH0418962.1 Putative aminoacrylate hydrolase RutD [Periweissella ghanensis]
MEKVLITEDGSQITYDFYPRKDTQNLVLIHGNAGNRHYFDAQLAIYRRDFQVLTFDSRAHGQSSNTAKNLTFEQIADDLAALLTAENITKTAIMGFSDGANVAIVFAKNYPQFVTSLVLNAGNLRTSGLLLWVRIVDELMYWTTKIVSFIAPKFRRYVQIQKLLMQDIPVAWSDLHAIKAPTLVISGNHDVVRLSHTRRIAAELPNSELKIISGGHHSYGKTYPILFAKKVVEFIKFRGSK